MKRDNSIFGQRVEAVERQLLRDIQKLTSRRFVYEDGWCGMVPFHRKLTEMQTGPLVPFGDLTWREQADVLRSFIHWDRYPERDWNDEYTIRENISAGKRPDQWLEGTSLRESFRLLADGKMPPPPKQCPEITQQELLDAFGIVATNTSGPKAKDGNGPELSSAGAKTLHDILHGDQPKQQESKTQERGGREI